MTPGKKRCSAWKGGCHFHNGPHDVIDTREKGCTIPKMDNVLTRECCRCGRKQWYTLHWDDSHIYVDSAY